MISPVRLLFAATFLIASFAGASADPVERAFGETVYVPAYSKIGLDTGRIQPLASTLSVHNVDPSTSIRLDAVLYYDDEGVEQQAFLDAPVTLRPFQSANYLVAIRDTAGGIGANFIVRWSSDAPAIVPLIEAIMVGGTGTMGLSFTTKGRVLKRTAVPDE